MPGNIPIVLRMRHEKYDFQRLPEMLSSTHHESGRRTTGKTDIESPDPSYRKRSREPIGLDISHSVVPATSLTEGFNKQTKMTEIGILLESKEHEEELH